MNGKFLGLTLIVAAMIQGVVLWADHHPMFFFGDSAAYLATALLGWLPSDRSFIYGYFIRLAALPAGSLTALVAVQVLMSLAICVFTAHLLMRYFRVRPWIACGMGILMSLEPIQLLYSRYVMTETAALFVFVFYVWVGLEYLERRHIRWLMALQMLAVLLIAVRFAFIPVVWICALVLPLLAIRCESGWKQYAGRAAMHVALSVLLLLTLTTFYKHAHGVLQQKPPAYSYDDGFFALGFVLPIVEPGDFPDLHLGERIINESGFPTSDRRNRAGHRWLDDGVVSRLQKLAPDRLEANAMARKTAINAVLNKPLAFVGLGWQSFADYFDGAYLRLMLEVDVGNRRLDEPFLGRVQKAFAYPADRSSPLELRSVTGRYFLHGVVWVQVLLFVPLIWLLLTGVSSESEIRRKTLFAGLLALTFLGIALFLVERPTPRYLHPMAWLACAAGGLGCNQFIRFRKETVKNRDGLVRTIIAFAEESIGFLSRHDKLFWIFAGVSVVVLLLLKSIIFYQSTGALCFGDEFIYKKNAYNFFSGIPIPSAHYPPLYSLLLAPAFLFSNWYDVMIRMNGLLSILLVVPVWLIAKSFLPVRYCAMAVVLSLMIPFQIIYPGYILSENLFLPVFALAVLLALKGADAGAFRAAMFGAVLAAGYLTRHLMLPAVFILAGFWILLPYITVQKDSFPSSARIRSNTLIMACCFLTAYSLWLFYTMHLDIPAAKAMGFGISGFRAPHQNPSAALLWLSAYGSYVILAAAPFLVSLIAWGLASVSKRRFDPVSREAVFAALILVLTLCYLAVATNHSYSAGYNAANPKYLIGRYLMFLTPLYIVLGLVAVKRLVDKDLPVRRWHIVASALLAVMAIIVARWVLHGGGIWGLPGWFADIEFNSPDAFVYKSPLMVAIAVSCVAASAGLLWFRAAFAKSRWSRHLPAALIVLLLVWYAAIYGYAAGRLPMNADGLHPRRLAPALSERLAGEAKRIDLFYDIPGLTEKAMRIALSFWGVDRTQVRVYSVFHSPEAAPPDTGAFFMLSRHPYYRQADLSYAVGGETYFLYKIDTRKGVLPLGIHHYGPAIVRAGGSFNSQSGGHSAIWVKTAHATSWTRITLNGREARSVVESNKTVTAVVPDALLVRPGRIEVRLKDRLTGAQSDSVFIDVTP